MTSRLIGLDEKEEKSSRKSLAWSLFKLCFGVAAVGSVFLLEQRLNEAGCRYAVNAAVPGLGAGFLAVFRNMLDHKYADYVLDAGYLLAVGFVLFFSVQGMADLESGGCEKYFMENTDTEVKPTTRFMNESEYREWRQFREYKIKDSPELIEKDKKSQVT